MSIIISKHHRLANKTEIAFDDLKDETFVLIDQEHSRLNYDHLLEECRKHGFFPKIRYAPTNESILDYLEIASYVAFYNKINVANKKDKFKCYPTPSEYKVSYVCMWNKNNSNPVLEQFIKAIESGVKAL